MSTFGSGRKHSCRRRDLPTVEVIDPHLATPTRGTKCDDISKKRDTVQNVVQRDSRVGDTRGPTNLRKQVATDDGGHTYGELSSKWICKQLFQPCGHNSLHDVVTSPVDWIECLCFYTRSQNRTEQSVLCFVVDLGQ